MNQTRTNVHLFFCHLHLFKAFRAKLIHMFVNMFDHSLHQQSSTEFFLQESFPVIITNNSCGGLTLAGCQVLIKAALSLPSSTGQGRENTAKGSWVQIRTGRLLTSYHHRQNRLNLGKLI